MLARALAILAGCVVASTAAVGLGDIPAGYTGKTLHVAFDGEGAWNDELGQP